MCSGYVRKAKANWELNLSRDSNRKGKYINSKRKARENMDLLLSEAGDMVIQDMENAEVINAAFSLVFTSKVSFQES